MIGEKYQLDPVDLSMALSWNLIAEVGERLKIPYIRFIGRHPVNTVNSATAVQAVAINGRVIT